MPPRYPAGGVLVNVAADLRLDGGRRYAILRPFLFRGRRMTRTAAGWPVLALWACTAAGCALLPTNLDPGPSADPDADPGQECLRRIRPGMPVEQARKIAEALAPQFQASGANGYSRIDGCFLLESWRLDGARFLSVFHDGEKVRGVKIRPYGQGASDPGQECLRLIRPGMTRDLVRWIVLETAPDAGPPMTSVTCVSIVFYDDSWILDGSKVLSVSYDGRQVVERVGLNGSQEKVIPPAKE
jgi:hypothetical protein